MKNNLFAFFLISFLWMSCTERESPSFKSAKAVLESVDDSGVEGIIHFKEEEGGVKITAWFTGLTPGEHGLAIHEHGLCSGMGASDAGLHFNPENSPHAGPFDSPGHVGDLGNVVANWRGRAGLERHDFVITLEGPDSILGKSVVINKFRDNYRSQPSGNAGPGVACGIIVLE